MTASSLQIAAGKKITQMSSPTRKGKVGNTPSNLNPRKGIKEELWQAKNLCAAGDECQMGSLPLFPQKHRCGACGFAVHVPCGKEVWSDNPYHMTQTEVFNTVCFACIKNKKWTNYIVQRDHAQMISLKNKDVREVYQREKGNLKLVETARTETKKPRVQQQVQDTSMKDADGTNPTHREQQPETPTRRNGHDLIPTPANAMEVDTDDSSTGDQTIHMTTVRGQPRRTDHHEDNQRPTKSSGHSDATPQAHPQTTEAKHGQERHGTQRQNKSITRRFLDIKVPIGQPTENDAGAGYRNLKAKLIDFFNGIHQVIPTFKLCELRADNPDMNSKLHDLSRFPERLEELRTYVRQAYIPNRNSEILYSKILAEWEGDEGSLRDLEWWMNQHNMAVYISKLQTPDHTRIGWFLYSVQSMGADDLAEKLKDIAARQYRISNPLIAMRWSRIANKEKALPDDPKAMQIEVAYHQVDAVKKMLRELYSPTAKQFPLHMRMRFVVGMDELGSADSVAKFNRLRARQGLWVAQAVGRVTTELVNIDYVDPHIGKSLRDLIAEIPATTGATSTPLIHSIGRHYRGGYYYTCHPRKVTEAQMVINGLYARLYHFHQERINQFFTPGAIHRAQGMTFDPTTGRVRTEGDTIIENIEVLDDDLVMDPKEPEAGLIPQREILVEERTIDSVSTLGGGPRQQRQNRSTSGNPANRQATDASVNSLDSRVTAMEESLSVIMASMHNIQNSLSQGRGTNPSTPRNPSHTHPTSGVQGLTDQSQALQPPIISPNQQGFHQSESAGQADKRF